MKIFHTPFFTLRKCFIFNMVLSLEMCYFQCTYYKKKHNFSITPVTLKCSTINIRVHSVIQTPERFFLTPNNKWQNTSIEISENIYRFTQAIFLEEHFMNSAAIPLKDNNHIWEGNQLHTFWAHFLYFVSAMQPAKSTNNVQVKRLGRVNGVGTKLLGKYHHARMKIHRNSISLSESCTF